MTRPTKAQAIERLQKARCAIAGLTELPYDSPEFKRWHRATRIAIDNAFRDIDGHLEEFTQIRFHASNSFVFVDYTRGEHQAEYVTGLASSDSLLASMIDEINENWKDEDQVTSSNVRDIEPTSTNEAFFVHGRDEGTKSTVARFLERLGLQPVVLAEQPSRGRTIIEKFERHAQVAFAVVLLTRTTQAR